MITKIAKHALLLSSIADCRAESLQLSWPWKTVAVFVTMHFLHSDFIGPADIYIYTGVM